MARGGYGTGSGIPLRDRVRAGSGPTPELASAPAAVAGTDTSAHPSAPQSPARHCWVTVPIDGPQARPGLLLEWRQVERGRWEGRVVYAAELRPGRWSLVEEWVPAELLAPP
ncbi:hypothetical protein [Nocardioides solisilvae]|uniref:hypothetical protein n=1 Tax=Nocardioides solisilvae TaxID=1542435 RepID=UPI000D746A93|nr:hypothetical protein [Nocardioides solisilvae]